MTAAGWSGLAETITVVYTALDFAAVVSVYLALLTEGAPSWRWAARYTLTFPISWPLTLVALAAWVAHAAIGTLPRLCSRLWRAADWGNW